MLKPEHITRSPWRYDIAPFQIADNVYYVGNTSVSSHLFDTGEGLLILDTGYMETGYLLLESIRELGYDPHDIRWILHSHAHIDHFGATRMLVEKYGCKTYLPAADAELLEGRSELNWCVNFGLPYEPPYDTYFKPDVLIQPGDVLTFGNTTVTAYSAAGHTPGTMAYVFTLPSGLKAAMHGGIGTNPLSAKYSAAHNLGSTWRDAYGESLKRLKGLEVDIILGNHPDQADVFEKLARKTDTENPFIDPTAWDRFLEGVETRYLAFLEKNPL